MGKKDAAMEILALFRGQHALLARNPQFMHLAVAVHFDKIARIEFLNSFRHFIVGTYMGDESAYGSSLGWPLRYEFEHLWVTISPAPGGPANEIRSLLRIPDSMLVATWELYRDACALEGRLPSYTEAELLPERRRNTRRIRDFQKKYEGLKERFGLRGAFGIYQNRLGLWWGKEPVRRCPEIEALYRSACKLFPLLENRLSVYSEWSLVEMGEALYTYKETR
ncbi:hypothetical protein EBT31_13465 [bacterium]|nr:hypothetical protein [bacterium]